MNAPTVAAVAAGDAWGVGVELEGWSLVQPRPVEVERPDGGISVPYDGVHPADAGFTGTAVVSLARGCRLEVEDRWSVAEDAVVLAREVRVRGSAPLAFGTSIALPTGVREWTEAEAFVPGVAYGDAPRVAERALAGRPSRLARVRHCLIREDRMAAPVFALRKPGGAWLGVLHLDPDGTTIAEDGRTANGGETLVDPRFAFASLGTVQEADGLTLGVRFPGSEGSSRTAAAASRCFNCPPGAAGTIPRRTVSPSGTPSPSVRGIQRGRSSAGEACGAGPGRL
ncbi:hypothetical protein [Naasia aerilata]|uniref:Uncharacterized protein n=1 Tax=Naasia aerilata TaxID=1162966 RepID=A0ABM8GAC3_9MICO|nr:hypothetical protein [Naasia aerilata]BDZ45143.1 hypothetical protein GCM10025866_10520 [Naasia aerilata]